MPKHVVVPYVENTLYSTIKYSCVRRVDIIYISYRRMAPRFEPPEFLCNFLVILIYYLSKAHIKHQEYLEEFESRTS